MTDKLLIIKQTVNAPSRKLTAKWSLEPPIPLKDVKDMTVDEEADEIIRRLKGIRHFEDSDNILTLGISFTPVHAVEFISLSIIINEQSKDIE